MVLAELARTGMVIAEKIREELAERKRPAGDLAADFFKVSKAVRLTVALEARLGGDAERLAEMAARHRPICFHLINIGLTLSRALEIRLLDDSDDRVAISTHEASEAFDKIAKAIRLTQALEAYLAKPRRPLVDPKLTLHLADEEVRKTAARKAVTELIERDVRDPRYERDLKGRLRNEFHRHYLSTDPISAIIAKLCTMLRLSPDWQAWASEDWAVHEADTRRCGSPYHPPAAPDLTLPYTEREDIPEPP